MRGIAGRRSGRRGRAGRVLDGQMMGASVAKGKPIVVLIDSDKLRRLQAALDMCGLAYERGKASRKQIVRISENIRDFLNAVGVVESPADGGDKTDGE